MIELETSRPPLNLSDYPRTYRPSGVWRVFLFLVATLVAIGGSLGIWYFGTGHEVRSPRNALMLMGICSAFVLLGLWLIVFLLRFRMVLLADGIEVRELISTRTLRREEILGWKVIPGHNGPPTLMLVLRGEKRRTLKIMSIFRRDAAFANWLDTLRNLDADEALQSAEEVANDPELGGTPEERIEELTRAKRIATVLDIVAGAAMAWGFFFPRPYGAAVVTLVALPWIAVMIAWRSHGLYRIDERRNDIRPNIALPFTGPGFVLLLRVLFDLHILRWQKAIWLSIAIGFVLWFVALMADPMLRKTRWIAVVLLVFASAYGAGAGLLSNALLDKAPATTYSAKVLAKDIASGKRTEYKLHLSAWGDEKEPDTVTVPRPLYDAVQPGDSVCLKVRPGALGVPWYTVRGCR